MNLKNSMYVNFNQSELSLLSYVLVNERERWDDFCLSPNITTVAKSNYEADSIHLDKLIFESKCNICEDVEAKILLNAIDIGFIIEALDNEIEMLSSNFTSENDQLLKNLRERIKNETLNVLGDRFLKIAHYDRNIK